MRVPWACGPQAIAGGTRLRMSLAPLQSRSYNGDTKVDLPLEHSMIKNLVKHGNSWAVVIDRPILDILKIDPESPLELTTDGKSILISPATGDDAKVKVRQARAKVNAKHSEAFKKLAE